MRRLLLLVAVVAGCNSLSPLGGIPIQRDLDDPLAAAVAEIDGCPAVLGVRTPLPDAVEIDRAIDAAGGGRGMVEIGDIEVFWGTVEVAADLFDGKALFLGRDGEAWIRTDPGEAVRLRSIATPTGRQLWLLGETASVDPCP